MIKTIFLIGTILTMLFTQNAVADSYWGLSTSVVNVDNSDYSGDALNVGVFLGVDVSKVGSNPLAIEVDINTTLLNGTGRSGSTGFDWDTQSTAIFAAMRTGSDNYLKVKLGVHNTKTSVDASGISDSGTANGLAFGASLKFSDYEIGYTVLKGETSSDADISLFGLGFHF